MRRDKRQARTSAISQRILSDFSARTIGNAPSGLPRRMLRMVRCDIASAVTALANEILTTSEGQTDGSELLDRLRRRLQATDTVLWSCDEDGIRQILWSGRPVTPRPEGAVDLTHDSVAVRRLRHAGIVLCRAGEVTGLEPLVPSGVQSFVAAASPGGDAVTSVLVVGWPTQVPPCTTGDTVLLQVAAALLAGRLSVALPAGANDAGWESILASLPNPIVVIDRAGIVVAANSPWLESTRYRSAGSAIGPGTDYLAPIRRAAAGGAQDAAALIEGIAAVSDGALDHFRGTCRYEAAGQQRHTVVSVMPFRHPRGGAVIAHADLHDLVAESGGESADDATFERLASEVPVPLIVLDRHGRVLHANQQWRDAIGDRGGPASGRVYWTEHLDADAKAQADAALRAVATRREPVDLDLRLKDCEGRYRWWTGTLAPRFDHAGDMAGCTCVCHDTTETRRVRSTLSQVAKKLVAAQEAERAHIARELHDDLGQQLALLATQLDMLRPTADFAHELEGARTSLQAIAGSLTSLSHQLHPGKVRLLGIARSLEGLCREVGTETGARIECDSRAVPQDLPEDTSVSLFRVAQEALRNAVKHSGATKIIVRLLGTRAQVTLRVTDNGKGFDALASESSGIGLLTMRERVELVNGTLTVEPAVPHGTTIRVVVPAVPRPAVRTPASRRAVAAPLRAPVLGPVARRASAAQDPRSTA